MVCGCLLVVTMLSIAGAAGHPDPEPDHGIDNETFATLWAGDEDITDPDAFRNATGNRSELVALAAATDIPLDEPPAAVERWNRGDLAEFPATDRSRSVFPRGAARRNGTYLKDVTVSIFAVQPSTRARVNPNDTNLLVASEGAVLGTTDYRVTVPDADRSWTGRTRWTLLDAHIAETRLLVDDEVESRVTGEATPRLEFGNLEPGVEYTLTLETEARVNLSVLRQWRVRVCESVRNETTGNETEVCESEWRFDRDRVTETVVVRDTTEVRAYGLSIRGRRTRYPDGDIGLSLGNDDLWLGYETDSGEVNGVWRFYVAREPEWDILVSSTERGSTEAHSPLHPLQVHAYPFEPGPTTDGVGMELLDSDGIRLVAPELPETVLLDAPPDVYQMSFEVRTRVDGQPGRDDWPQVTARGLVRGVAVSPDDIEYSEMQLHRSNLTVRVLNVTEETATVRLTLLDAETGAPIDTGRRFEAVYLDGEQFVTDEEGLATVTIERPSGGLTARYEPRPWWQHGDAYLPDSETVYLRGTAIETLSILYTAGVPISLFLLAVFFIDRITHWGVWPPWRGL